MLQISEHAAPSIVAHRGRSAECPGNTRAAFAAAVECGAECMEFDIQVTADRHVVVCHNPALDHYGFPGQFIAHSTLAELQRLDIGAAYGTHFAGERMMTFEEVLAEFGTRIRMLVEFKTRHLDSRQVTTLLRRFLEISFPDRDQLQLKGLCFRPNVLRLLHQSADWLPLIWNTNSAHRITQFDLEHKPWLSGVGCRIAELSVESATLIHQAGMRLFSFTCNEADDVLKARDLGAHAIISDDPVRTRQILAGQRVTQPEVFPASTEAAV